MNRLSAAVPAIAACMVMYCVSSSDVWGQTGAAAAKQMQDTQRAAQKKARDAKNSKPDQMKKEDAAAPAPASDSQ